jgi:hypothetical protein
VGGGLWEPGLFLMVSALLLASTIAIWNPSEAQSNEFAPWWTGTSKIMSRNKPLASIS